MDSSSFTFRSFVTKGFEGLDYHVVLSPLKDASGSIRIMAVGEDADYPIDIKSAIDESGNSLDVDGSMVKGIKLYKGTNCKLAVKLNSGRRYALGVESYEN